MRHQLGLAIVAVLAVLCAPSAQAQAATPKAVTRPQAGVIVKSNEYVLIGWNDLGMHCISPRFEEMAILPPYNNLRALVIRRGEEPKVVTSNINVSFWIDNNTTSKGKTDFWTYAPQLFGKNLPQDIGLTGVGLKGPMAVAKDRAFEAIGIPVVPKFDNGTWNPYQRATIAMSVGKGQPFKNITSVVVPVSDEINCGKCHSKAPFNSPTLEGKILMGHDKKFGTKLMDSRPVLCGSCHADAALGTTGRPGLKNLSLAMHGYHADLPAARQPGCYDCHPGPKTQCNRSAIEGMGNVHGDPNCQRCHGDLQKMATGLRAGRRPWVDLPTCAQCHGAKYSTGKVLYRNAKGHGGVLCVACHNSPHAWYPSQRADDNLQVNALQGNTHALGYKKCSVCHTKGRSGTVPPHGDDDDD